MRTRCAKCGRKLVDPYSQKVGLGPECRTHANTHARTLQASPRRLSKADQIRANTIAWPEDDKPDPVEERTRAFYERRPFKLGMSAHGQAIVFTPVGLYSWLSSQGWETAGHALEKYLLRYKFILPREKPE